MFKCSLREGKLLEKYDQNYDHFISFPRSRMAVQYRQRAVDRLRPWNAMNSSWKVTRIEQRGQTGRTERERDDRPGHRREGEAKLVGRTSVLAPVAQASFQARRTLASGGARGYLKRGGHRRSFPEQELPSSQAPVIGKAERGPPRDKDAFQRAWRTLVWPLSDSRKVRPRPVSRKTFHTTTQA